MLKNFDDGGGGGGRRCSEKLGFAETELRLGIGLPAGDDAATADGAEKCSIGGHYGKRGYAETMDLKLNLDGGNGDNHANNNNSTSSILPDNNRLDCPTFAVKSPAKAQAVGWPPVRSFRKNAMAVHQKSTTDESGAGAFVKVSMDGAPYLRKVDLKMYKTYKELSEGLAKMFSNFTTMTTTAGKCDSEGMVDFMNEKKAMESEYVPTYEDKDGDWMLVGDVPWEMFVGSCKRLRIMKGTDAKGLAAPRAVEKCTNRN